MASEPAIAQAQAKALALVRAAMSELDWQRTVEAALDAGGWQWIHIRDARRQHVTGFPDVFACRGAVAIAVELKRQRGTPTAAQQRWLATLAAAGIQTYLWRPADTDEMYRVLLTGCALA